MRTRRTRHNAEQHDEGDARCERGDILEEVNMALLNRVYVQSQRQAMEGANSVLLTTSGRHPGGQKRSGSGEGTPLGREVFGSWPLI